MPTAVAVEELVSRLPREFTLQSAHACGRTHPPPPSSCSHPALSHYVRNPVLDICTGGKLKPAGFCLLTLKCRTKLPISMP